MRKGTGWIVAGLALGALAAGEVARRRRRFLAQRERNREVRVLVLGAGVVGSTYAAHLARWGLDVTLLARGRRLQELTELGLQVEDAFTHRRVSAPVHLVSEVSPQEEYDLVLVVVRFTQVLEALEAVAPLAETTPILLLQNNPVGAEVPAGRLGERRFLMGFPATGGELVRGVVRSLPLWLGATTIGEPDGADTQRLHLAAGILRRAGLKVEVQRRIVPWLQTHAAMIAALAACAYRNGGHVRQMARSTDEVQLYLQAVREAYTILAANGIPITPPAESQIFAQPLWLQVALVRLMAFIPWVSLLIDSHLAAAPEEMKALYDHLMLLARRTNVEAPVLTSLGQAMGLTTKAPRHEG